MFSGSHHQQWSSGLLSMLLRYAPMRACPDLNWLSALAGVGSGLPFFRRIIPQVAALGIFGSAHCGLQSGCEIPQRTDTTPSHGVDMAPLG